MPSIINSLRLLADPTRVRLLSLLDQEELSVAEIQEILGMGQSRVSSHLARLKRAGLVRDRRSGKHIYYGVTGESPWIDLREVVRRGAEEISDTRRDTTALQMVIRKRQDTAREYFNLLAGKFGRHYCPGRTWRGLGHLLLGVLPPMDIADLGAGEGTLSQLLARRARHVIAVDNSEKMVEFGRELISKHGFANLEYRLGDIEDPPIDGGTMDLAILSQALHHATHPERALAAAHRILKPGGRIAVLDLLSHHFEEARELYADLWLGFGEAELHGLLETSGFHDIEVAVVARDDENPQFQTLLAMAVKA